jgi:hypothetical protein
VKRVAYLGSASTLAWHCSFLLDGSQRPFEVAASVPPGAGADNLIVFIGAIEFLDRKDLSHAA